LQYISASLERLILYLNPTLVLILGWVLYQRKITYRQAVAMAVSYSGVLLVFGHEISLEGDNVALGAALVFGSAVTYAIYLSYSGQLVQRLGSLRLAGLATTVACFFCILQFVLLKPMSALNVAPDVLWLSMLNATACTVLPVLMVMMAIERIGPGLTSQIGMIGPMSTLTMGAFWLNETFNMWILTGTALVLGGVFWVTQGPRQANHIQ
jgi:drug/metabolite transporter (DMT)-like permease